MKKPTHDLRSPKWNWRLNVGRLRIAFMSRYRWRLYGATPINWFFFATNNESYSWEKGRIIGKFIQVTILGLQIGIMYNLSGYDLTKRP